VLDIVEPLDRDGMPFLVVHVGCGRRFCVSRLNLAACLAGVRAAGNSGFGGCRRTALRGCTASAQAIGEQLERLTLTRGDPPHGALLDLPAKLRDPRLKEADPIGRVTRTIDRLGQQMRSREEGYTALQANLDHMLDTLRDGVLLIARTGAP